MYRPTTALGPIPSCLSKGFVPSVSLSTLHHQWIIHISVKKTNLLKSRIPLLMSFLCSPLVKSLLKMYTSNQLLVLLQTLNLALLSRIHINNSCRITTNLLTAKSKEYDCAAIIFLSQFFPFEYMAPLTIHTHLNQTSQPQLSLIT